MKDRVFAIIADDKLFADNALSIAQQLISQDLASEVYAFTCEEDSRFFIKSADGKPCCQNVVFPQTASTSPKKRNWINSFFKQRQFKGFLHVVASEIAFDKPLAKFLADLEAMMEDFDYPLWLNTATDVCNFLYKKYMPRLAVKLDVPDYSSRCGSKLVLTSHSNVNWVAYDFERISDSLLKFDEDFTIAMFYIVEILARRRAEKKPSQLFYMNQYLTVESEHGSFHSIASKNDADDMQKMKEEDMLFKSKNINYAPDNSIDQVLEDILNAVQSKSVQSSKTTTQENT